MDVKILSSLFLAGLLLVASPLFFIFGLPLIAGFCIYWYIKKNQQCNCYCIAHEKSCVMEEKENLRLARVKASRERVLISQQVKEKYGDQSSWMFCDPNDKSQIIIIGPNKTTRATVDETYKIAL